MKVRAVMNRQRAGGEGLRLLEVALLLVGLAAVDVFIWGATSSLFYQAYQDWAFDQRLRALEPSVGRFAADEWRAMFGKNPVSPLPAERLSPSKLKEEAVPAHPPSPAGVIGRLDIPGLHLSAMVREGADAGTLHRAVGHIPGTALPGMEGNVGLAGHRDTFFRPLRNIQVNDPIELETERATYRYVVESTRVVGPRDVRVLASSAGGETLTLVTCYPFYYVGSAPKRFIVRAALASTIAR